ncbi:MAG: acyl-CoA dehydrogenase [Microbacteriaceae bacterium]|nr:acyl-CoA dehydrogenase [Microbacteriaceae bacterium]
MEFSWSVADQKFREELHDVIVDAIPEHWANLIPGEEATSSFTMDFSRMLASKGLLTPHWPVEYGGRDASGWQFIILGEELWSAGEPRGSQYMNVNWVGPAIMHAGTDEQKAYHLKRISDGDVLWCQGFSELGAGTDLASIQTTAVRDGDHYVINGEKVWTSYAQGAEFCFLLARTDPSAERGSGVSIFLVPTATPGFTIVPFESDLDIHEFNRMTFDNVRVPASTMLGEENNGWKVIKRALSHERIGGPRYERALAVTRRMADTAKKRGWWERDGLRTRFVAAEAACEAARVLVYQAIDAREKGLQENLVVSLARVAIVRSERLVADLALDLFEDESLYRFSTGNGQFKTSMIAGLGGGSVEVQLNTIARALLGPGR